MIKTLLLLSFVATILLNSCVPWYDKYEGVTFLSPVVITTEPAGNHRIVPIWKY